jgi:hypothetical protein
MAIRRIKTTTTKEPPGDVIACTPKYLPRPQWNAAAQAATKVNPLNRPAVEHLGLVTRSAAPTQAFLAVLTTKYWGSKGVELTVGFLDNPPADLRQRILAHMNAWDKTGNVRFTATSTDPQVRIARVPGGGYWSYIGTDILQIKKDAATMNLDSFTMQTPESEYHRVVRHETGHTLGFPHEHMRRALVALIDRDKAFQHFGDEQGWDKNMVIQQVLTPLEESSLLATDNPDPDSIMCYQIPGSITKNGKTIAGGLDIDPSDFEFIARIYPKPKPSAPSKSRTRSRKRSAR